MESLLTDVGGAYSAMFLTNVWPRQTLPPLLLSTITAATGVTVLAWATYTETLSVVYGMMSLAGFGIGMAYSPGTLHGLAYFPELAETIQCIVTFAGPLGGTVGLTLMATVFNAKGGLGGDDPKTGVMWAFIAVTPILWGSVVVTMFRGNVWIRPIRDGGHDVVHGVWLWSLCTGKKLQKERIVRGDLDGLPGEGSVRRTDVV